MEKATISQLKNRLSAYLKKVRAGSSVLILDRDQPIARLERVDAGARSDDRLSRLERSGILRRGRRPLNVDRLRADVPTAQGSILEALLDDRSEGR